MSQSVISEMIAQHGTIFLYLWVFGRLVGTAGSKQRNDDVMGTPHLKLLTCVLLRGINT